jgi:hypothetical protein
MSNFINNTSVKRNVAVAGCQVFTFTNGRPSTVTFIIKVYAWCETLDDMFLRKFWAVVRSGISVSLTLSSQKFSFLALDGLVP